MAIHKHPLSAAAVGILLLTVAACTSPPQATVPAEVEPEAPATLPDLWEAADAGDLEGLEAHRRAGTDLDRLHPEVGVTALVSAVAGNQTATAQWLLANGADVNARNGDGGTALHAAAFLGLSEPAKVLLTAGIDVNARSDEGLTVWDLAALDWQTTDYIATNLLQISLDRQAVEAGRGEILGMLEPYLAVQAANDIWAATATGNVEAVRSQLAAGGDANQRHPDSGATPLSIAGLFGHAEIAKLLLDAGADVDARNYNDGSTPLHAAAFLGRTDLVRLLLEHGADVDAMSDNGGTPLQASELDWATTRYLAGMLQVPIDENAVKAGKAATAELLRTKQ